MTLFVQRDVTGVVVGIYAVRQPGFAEEELPEDHPDVVVFLSQPSHAPRSTAMWRARAVARVTDYNGGPGKLFEAVETAIDGMSDPLIQSAALEAWNSGATTFDLDGQLVPVLMGALGMTEEDVLPLIEAAEALPA